MSLRRSFVLLSISSLLFLLLLLSSPTSASPLSDPFQSLARYFHPLSPRSRDSDDGDGSVISVPTTSSFSVPKATLHPSTPSIVSSDDSEPLTSTEVWVVALVLALVGFVILFGTYLAVSL